MKYFLLTNTFVAALLFTGLSHAEVHQFTFAWPYTEASEMKPRGGTTTGTTIELDTTPGNSWQALQHPDLSKFERDRRAILAMAGAYRASFDFIETVGFELPYTEKRPYQSWGTEYVYVVADKKEFISLQHILVMRIQLEDGSSSEPMVVKHWRQDWTFEDRSMHTYRGNRTWAQQRLKKPEARGQWTQAVFQVDDSPRYESVGQWRHLPNYSTWVSGETWRPLPRREFSVRQDYDALVGENRHTITPLGWIHEEQNLKVKVTDTGEIDSVIARETGFNRYERINNFDFSAGDEYWQHTQAFWADVALAWNQLFASHKQFTIASEHNNKSLIGEMFAYAGQLNGEYDSAAGQQFIAETLANFVETGTKP